MSLYILVNTIQIMHSHSFTPKSLIDFVGPILQNSLRMDCPARENSIISECGNFPSIKGKQTANTGGHNFTTSLASQGNP